MDYDELPRGGDEAEMMEEVPKKFVCSNRKIITGKEE